MFTVEEMLDRDRENNVLRWLRQFAQTCDWSVQVNPEDFTPLGLAALQMIGITDDNRVDGKAFAALFNPESYRV